MGCRLRPAARVERLRGDRDHEPRARGLARTPRPDGDARRAARSRGGARGRRRDPAQRGLRAVFRRDSRGRRRDGRATRGGRCVRLLDRGLRPASATRSTTSRSQPSGSRPRPRRRIGMAWCSRPAPRTTCTASPTWTTPIARLTAYRRAGANIVYAPRLVEADDMRRIVDAVDAPVNVLAMLSTPPIPVLHDLGVRRVSTGGWLAPPRTAASSPRCASFGRRARRRISRARSAGTTWTTRFVAGGARAATSIRSVIGRPVAYDPGHAGARHSPVARRQRRPEPNDPLVPSRRPASSLRRAHSCSSHAAGRPRPSTAADEPTSQPESPAATEAGAWPARVRSCRRSSPPRRWAAR